MERHLSLLRSIVISTEFEARDKSVAVNLKEINPLTLLAGAKVKRPVVFWTEENEPRLLGKPTYDRLKLHQYQGQGQHYCL